MLYPNVLKQLNQELSERKRSLEKSIQSFKRGSIDEKLHLTHIKNLNPIIKEYESAIKKLKSWTTKTQLIQEVLKVIQH